MATYGLSRGGHLPTFLILEIFHWITNQQKIEHPILKCISVGFSIGILVVIFQVGSASGESGLVAVAISPFIFFGFLFGGFIVGLIYKYRGKPFIFKRMKKTDG